MGRAIVGGLVGLLVLGCCAADGGEGGDTTPVEPAPPQAHFAEALPTGGAARPTTIVVRNGTDADVMLHVSWGDGSPFAATALDRPLGLLGLHDGFFCECDCAAEGCVDCEEPADRIETVPPGEAWSWEWDGWLTRHRVDAVHGACFDKFAPAEGRYLLTACAEGAPCAAREVTLPASGPIEIELGAHAVGPASCDDPALADRAAAVALARMELFGVAPDRIAACEDQPVTCVPEGGEPQPTTPPGGRQLFATMSGSEVSVLVHVPRDGDPPEQSRNRSAVTAGGTRITSVAYGR